MSDPLIGIDTNIVVRLLAKDEATQFDSCVRLVKEARTSSPLMINPLVAAEAVWTLERGLKMPLSLARSSVARLLDTKEFEVPTNLSTGDWGLWFGDTHPGFFDVVIASTNEASGCEFTYTFDKRAARHVPGMKLLQ
ncbi:MAG: PIN domain-containing protein [Pseudomonadota bacterium]